MIVGLRYIFMQPWVQQSLKAYACNAMEKRFGSKPLTVEQEEKIKAIATRMDITKPLIIRSMNLETMRTFGYHNLFVAFHHFFDIFPSVDTPFLLVSKDFFEDLSEEEQLFIIGHELAHAKKEHGRYLLLTTILLDCLCILLLWLLWNNGTALIRLLPQHFYTANPIPERYRSGIFLGISISSLLLTDTLIPLAYRRHIEWEADTISFTKLQSHDGCIKLMNRWTNEHYIPAYNPYGGILADHPANNERKHYCIQHKNKNIQA